VGFKYFKKGIIITTTDTNRAYRGRQGHN